MRGVRIAAPKQQTLKDIIMTVREKAIIPKEEEVIIMVGE